MMRALTLAMLALSASAFMAPNPLRSSSSSAAVAQTHAAKVRKGGPGSRWNKRDQDGTRTKPGQHTRLDNRLIGTINNNDRAGCTCFSGAGTRRRRRRAARRAGPSPPASSTPCKYLVRCLRRWCGKLDGGGIGVPTGGLRIYTQNGRRSPPPPPCPPLPLYTTRRSDAMSKMNELAAKSNTLTKDLAVCFFLILKNCLFVGFSPCVYSFVESVFGCCGLRFFVFLRT